MLSGPWKVKYVPHSDIGGEGYICLCTQLFVCTVLLSEQCTQIIFYHFKPLCINDINYNYATAAFLSALCPLSLFTSWHLQQEACINQIYNYTNRMMSIIHLSVVLIFLLSGACLGCISRVTVDFSTLNKMFTENFFENKILNHSLVALTWGFFLCVCLLQFDKPGAREGDYPDMAKEAGADLYRLLVIHSFIDIRSWYLLFLCCYKTCNKFYCCISTSYFRWKGSSRCRNPIFCHWTSLRRIRLW